MLSELVGLNFNFLLNMKKREEKPSVENLEKEETGLQERVIKIFRCSKVVKGGRRFSFAALVVVGGEGRVGVGYGKAKEVPDAIKKASERAHKNLVEINLKDTTIPHEVLGKADAGKVMLKPACPGTGVIAGGGVRAVLEVLGVKDVLTKSLGSANPKSLVRATMAGLLSLRTKEMRDALRKSA